MTYRTLEIIVTDSISGINGVCVFNYDSNGDIPIEDLVMISYETAVKQLHTKLKSHILYEKILNGDEKVAKRVLDIYEEVYGDDIPDSRN